MIASLGTMMIQMAQPKALPCEFKMSTTLGFCIPNLARVETRTGSKHALAWGQKTQPSTKHCENRAFNRLPSVNLGRTDARNCVDNVSAIVLTRTKAILDRSPA